MMILRDSRPAQIEAIIEIIKKLESEGISVIDGLHPSSDRVGNFTSLLRDTFDP